MDPCPPPRPPPSQLILLARGYKSLEEDSRCKAVEAERRLVEAETQTKLLQEQVRDRTQRSHKIDTIPHTHTPGMTYRFSKLDYGRCFTTKRVPQQPTSTHVTRTVHVRKAHRRRDGPIRSFRRRSIDRSYHPFRQAPNRHSFLSAVWSNRGLKIRCRKQIDR